MLEQLSVLLVEDHRAMRSIVRSVLRSVGIHRLTDLDNRDHALDTLRRGYVDLLLVDWGPGRTDGLELVNFVRHSPDSPDRRLPIVLMTAHTERSRVAAARDAGVNALLRKPISAQTLLERISAALTDVRPFVASPSYYGPERRRRPQGARHVGPFRRASDSYRDDDIVLEDAS